MLRCNFVGGGGGKSGGDGGASTNSLAVWAEVCTIAATGGDGDTESVDGGLSKYYRS